MLSIALVPFQLLGFCGLFALSGAQTLAFSTTAPVAPPPAPVVRARVGIAPRSLSAEAKFSFYSAIVEAGGGHVVPGRTAVLGLRGMDPQGRRHPSCENVGPYDDTFVVLKRDARGAPEVSELRGSTHAGQESSTLSPGGVAQIRPGTFRAIPQGEHEGMPCWLVVNRNGDDHIPCWRDVDRDGVISRAERVDGKAADGILFHNGRFADHGSSIGCQTMRPDVHQRFIDCVGRSSSFDFTLVDVAVTCSRR